MPKVSVILPSLNVYKYIRETLDSVCNQTLTDIEILCVDAGSTDGTMEVLEEYVARDSRVRIIRSEVKSYGYQMNLGIRSALGDYIGIVETDDYIAPEMYDVLYSTAIENDAEVVKSDFDMFTAGKNDKHLLVNYSLKQCNRVEYGSVYSKDTYINNESTVECYIWNAIYKKSFLLENDIWFNETPGASFQDFGFKYQVAFAAERIVAVNQSFYRYRRDNSGSSTYNSRTAEFNLRESKYLLSVLDKWNADDATYAAAAREILQFAVWPYTEICKWNEPAPSTKAALQEYHAMFGKFQEHNWIQEHQIDGSLWLGYHLLLDSVDLFDGYVRVTSEMERKRVRSTLDSLKQKEQIVIYGSGKRGNAIFAFLTNNNCTNIVAFCDGDENKWESVLYNIKIVSPEEAARRYPGATFILSVPSGATSMIERLGTSKITKDQILVYRLPVDPLFCTNCMIG